MEFSSSQILSNFKLFSKIDDADLIVRSDASIYYKYVFAIFIIILCFFVYFKRMGDLNGFMAKLWVNSHLTSCGELASTYVPKHFFGSSNADDFK